jgi:hypothetical protein
MMVLSDTNGGKLIEHLAGRDNKNVSMCALLTSNSWSCRERSCIRWITVRQSMSSKLSPVSFLISVVLMLKKANDDHLAIDVSISRQLLV